MKSIAIGILGATSYTGIELLKILARHKASDIVFASSQSYAGQALTKVFPEMTGIFDQVLFSPEDAAAKANAVECVFSCLPHATSAGLLLPYIKAGVRVIDFSADFRLNDSTEYTKWYKEVHPCPELLPKAVFGLCEHNREAIKTCQILANPGCYPTSILMPVLGIVAQGATVQNIIADSKSGVSGAGRSLKITSLFAEANENFSAYSVGRKHRHIAEIDQELSKAIKKPMQIVFSPHLVPMNRGILSTIYISTDKTPDECIALAKKQYADEPFVRVRESDDLPKVAYVAHTNYCDFTFVKSVDNGPVIAVSVIDNLVKGASGQAVQNMNIMFGIEETEGLK
jgi:N-acetyl-gamma-glutamyl-phosphate reductase